MSSSSDQLFSRARQLFPGGVNSPVRAFRSIGGTPFFTTRTDGPHLYTADNKKLIDYVCTWGPAIHGHNHPVIRAAISRALDNGTSFGTPNELENQLAELILSALPSAQKIRFCNSGTEATMTAIRLARGFTKRDKIIKFSGCYHGHSDSLLIKAGSGALTHGNPDSAGVPQSFAAETIVLPYNDTSALEAAFAANPSQIAGVIIEPYCGNVGFIMPDPGYLQFLRNITQKHNSLLIFDEVMTGFRISHGGVQQHENIIPDLTTLGKIIGGGLPVGAIAGTSTIMDYLAPEGPVYQAGTLSGNPLAMAAGISSLQLLQQQNPYRQLHQHGQQLRAALLETAKQKGIPLQVPQSFSMFSVFFTDTPVRDYATALKSDPKLYAKFFHHCLDSNLYLAPSPYEAAFLSTAHTPEIISQSIDILTAALRSL